LVERKFEEYVSDNLDRFANDVMRLIAQPSVSARNEGIEECALLVEQMLGEVGATTRLIRGANAAPLVYGEIKSSKSPKTVLFYNHYDVQPEDPLELWTSPPFKPEVRDGRIYGRGASDDKGELVSRLKLIQTFMEVDREPPCNVKFCVEGEEEVGSGHLLDYVSANKDLFRSDGVFWEFGEIEESGRPCVGLGMKGMMYVEITLKSLDADAHSSYAAVLPSAPWRMVRLLNLIKDGNERILIPGWYDGVESLSEDDTALLEAQEFDSDGFLRSHGAKGFIGGLTSSQVKKALVQRPTANIAGIWAGYTGPGSKTILPKEIHCKIDFRLVPNQDPKDLWEKLRKHLDSSGFGDALLDLEAPEPAARTSSTDPFARASISTAERVWGKAPIVRVSEAGTGPLYVFTRQYRTPAVTMGISSSDCGAHAPNEHLKIENLRKGILWFAETLDAFLSPQEPGK
jgi:acetylornithine deacetylase/succinyl-diaminopimelate desuccinylase-like protein